MEWRKGELSLPHGGQPNAGKLPPCNGEREKEPQAINIPGKVIPPSSDERGWYPDGT